MQVFRWVICVCVIGGEPSWPHERNVHLRQPAVACCHTGVCASSLGSVVLVHAPRVFLVRCGCGAEMSATLS